MLVNYLHLFHLDVYFVVQLGAERKFPAGSIVQFDKVKQYVGGSYIDNTNSADYGKFIAPVNGTHQFIMAVMNKDKADGFGILTVNGGEEFKSHAVRSGFR